MSAEKPNTKTCHYCHKVKDVSGFYLSRQGNPLRECKTCAVARGVRWRRLNPERSRFIAKTRSAKPGVKAYRRLWQKKNKDKLKNYQQRYMSKPGNLHARNLKAREKRRDNRDSINERYRELRQLRPEVYRDRDGRRKARELSAQEGITSQERGAIQGFYREVYAARRIKCYWCKRNVAKPERQVDHIIALARGGLHRAINLCCSCRTCNISKCDKPPEAISGQPELFI